MSRCLFITGTDTGCGKTTVTAALARLLAERGRQVACFKPVASGSEWHGDQLCNDDALRLMQAASVALPYERVNPITLAPPIAPHLAAKHLGLAIDIETLAADILAEDQAELKLVEGAGGWRVPLGDEAMTADLAQTLGGEVILVVAMRLGCINHALLSASAIEADGCRLVGWIANIVDPSMAELDGNIEAITARIGPPLAHYCGYQDWRAQQRLLRELGGKSD